jgi:flagellar hook-length control protein FliK
MPVMPNTPDMAQSRPDPAPPITLSILQAPGTPGQTAPQPGAFSGPMLATGQQDWPRDLAATLAETATLRRLGAGEMLEIRLDPETLGPVTVRLDLRDGTANVSIVTQTPEAARLFTDTQHRLADAMARAGLELGSHSAGTGDGRGGQSPQDARGQPGPGGPAPHDAPTDTPTQTLTLARSGPGRRIDLFA